MKDILVLYYSLHGSVKQLAQQLRVWELATAFAAQVEDTGCTFCPGALSAGPIPRPSMRA